MVSLLVAVGRVVTAAVEKILLGFLVEAQSVVVVVVDIVVTFERDSTAWTSLGHLVWFGGVLVVDFSWVVVSVNKEEKTFGLAHWYWGISVAEDVCNGRICPRG